MVSCLDMHDNVRKVSTLLLLFGRQLQYERVIEKLEKFFKGKKNVIYEYARFNCRDQQKGESAKEYITMLYKLMESCEYGGMKNE